MGVKYHLEPLCPVDSKGYMMEEAGEDLKGMFYEDANAKVLEKLEACGALLKATKIVHSYPHDWRTNKPLIFRATPQWFCSIDTISFGFRHFFTNGVLNKAVANDLFIRRMT